MARGGARPGAGRKAGGVNKLSQKAREAAAATGKLPHELLLMVARGQPLPGERGKPTRAERIDAMKAAAPYYAPRLAAVVAKVNPPGDLWKEIFSLIDGTSRGLPAHQTGGGKEVK